MNSPYYAQTIGVAMRTANRAPKQNYLRATLSDLDRSGADLRGIHLCARETEADWLRRELDGLPGFPTVHLSPLPLSANANGLVQTEVAIALGAELVLLLEDDLVFCADFLGSVSRWITRALRPDRHVYRLFGFTKPPSHRPDAYDWPLASCRASQAILLRTDDARDFLTWGRAHMHDWGALVPWGRREADPTIGFDKFVATWALLRWPGVPGVMSHPYFVKHIGDASSLHAYGLRNDRPFAGEDWRYRGEEATA